MAPRKKSKAAKPAETMRQKQMRLRRETSAKKLEKGPATVRGGQAPGAGRTGSSPKPKPKSGGTMVNRNKPTMRKLAAKAAQSRKAASGRPLVRKSELAKAAKPSIKEGAKKLRVPGDSGQVRAAQARGKAEVRKAVARRGAVAANRRMARKLAVSGAKRLLGGASKLAGRGALFYEGIKADNTAKGTLEEAKKKYGAKAMPQKQGPAAPKTTQSSFNKKSFNDAFRTARKSGAKTFTWRGKKYTTEMK